MNNKPQLHVTALNMLSKCGMQFQYRYLENRIIPPGVAAVVGKATHRSVEANLRAKIEKGELLSLDEIQSIARDSLEQEWRRGVLIREDEEGTPDEAKGKAADRAVLLSEIHATQRAPGIAPTAVERRWVLELDGYPLDLAGCTDIEEAETVRDTKTSGKSPSKSAADDSLQLTAYALAKAVLDGQQPKAVVLDYLVATKTKCYAAEPLVSTRDQADFDVFLRRVENAITIIEKGAFTPAQMDSWVCSSDWCGYFNICPYAKRPKVIAIRKEGK